MQPISDTQIEIIKATFAETGNLRASARAAGVSFATAKKYAGSIDAYEQVRAEKRVDIIEKIAEVQIKLLAEMTDVAHLAKASLNDIGVTFGIITDKRLLLSGQATTRSETINDPAARLTPDELVMAAQLRAKLVNDGAGRD